MKKNKKLVITILIFLIFAPVLYGCELGRIANVTDLFTIIVPAQTLYEVNVINGSGSNTCEENAVVTVVSTHSGFGYWYVDDINSPVSYEKSYTFTLTKDTTITAVDSFIGMSFVMFDNEVNAESALQNITDTNLLSDIATYTGYVENSLCTGGSEGYLLQEGTYTVVNATTINFTSTIYATSGYLVAWKRIKIGDNYNTILRGTIQHVSDLTPAYNYVCQDDITYYFTFNLVSPI